MAGPRDYSTATRAALAALSRARCYFPECDVPILRFISGEPYIEYQIAHIRDANPGNRYDATMTPDERRSFANLILLCKPHHEMVDKRYPDRYSVDDLEAWKRAREGGRLEELAEIGPVTEAGLEELLQQSIAGIQQHVTQVLRGHDAEVRSHVERMRENTSFEVVRDALEAMQSLGLLSDLGVRAETWITDFYLRIQLVDDALRVHLDTRWQASVFSTVWGQGESFSEALIRLADVVRPTGYWPGVVRWDFASALNRIVDTLLEGLTLKENGGWIRNVVQKVGVGWLLSDWEAIGLGHNYQILFSRLDELDWYPHLTGKGWADRTEVAEMLEQAAFLRTLANSGA